MELYYWWKCTARKINFKKSRRHPTMRCTGFTSCEILTHSRRQDDAKFYRYNKEVISACNFIWVTCLFYPNFPAIFPILECTNKKAVKTLLFPSPFLFLILIYTNTLKHNKHHTVCLIQERYKKKERTERSKLKESQEKPKKKKYWNEHRLLLLCWYSLLV